MRKSTAPARIAPFPVKPMPAAASRAAGVAGALAAVGLLAALLLAAPAARAEIEPADCAAIGVDGAREFDDCEHGSVRVRGKDGGRHYNVTVSVGHGFDSRATALFSLVRIEAGQYATIGDTTPREFAEWYLLDQGGDWVDAGTHGAYELTTVESRFEEIDRPLSCYVFLRQWGYAASTGYKNQLGGLFCPLSGAPARRAPEDLLDTLSY